MMRYLVTTLIAVIMPALAGVADTSGDDIKIGVRIDTPPFVSIDSNAYVGYFYDICTEAVTRSGFQFTQASVTASERNDFLTNGKGGFDLLCDPTTITLSRMRNFASQPVDPSGQIRLENPDEVEPKDVSALGFSQIVFIANGAYAAMPSTQKNDDAHWRYRLGQVQPFEEGKHCSTLFEDAEKIAKPTTNPPPKKLQDYIRFRYKPTVDNDQDIPTIVQVLGYVTGSTIGKKVLEYRADGVIPVACTFSSHEAAAQAFCEKKLDRYYGDLDIIRASLAKESARSGRDCLANYSPPTEFTYEPYAFVVSSRIPYFPEQFNCALYSMFEDGTIQSLYAGRFDGQISTYLSTLFRINSIPAGKPGKDDALPHVCGDLR